MSHFEVDLTNCDREPIHIPGKIQSHGFLLAVDADSFTTVYCSDNVVDFTGVPYSEVLNGTLGSFLQKLQPAEKDDDLLQVIRFSLRGNLEEINPIQVQIGERFFYLLLHKSNDLILLDFEPVVPQSADTWRNVMGSSLSRILEGKSLQETLDLAALQIREVIGYDRVMVYKFWEDGHGEVLAEQKRDDLEPFLGLHYPASDIPKQARDLYKINFTRIVADVMSTDAALLTSRGTDTPLDLTHSTLRAVSPIHIQYLKNMGVGASFSVSIICNDQLWGLIACHHYTARFIDYRARQHARLIGQVLSSSLQYRSNQEDKEINLAYRNAADEIVRNMHREWDLVEPLVNRKNLLLETTSAPGAALVYEGKVHAVGQTPSEEAILSLVSWLNQDNRRNIYYTDHLAEVYPPALKNMAEASGLLALTISWELQEYILFFKPELITQVTWAGNPNKPVDVDESGQQHISPRRSFAVWSDEVRGHSERWSKSELNVAYKFREDIIHFVNLKANEIRKLNDKLKEAYDELDTFSFTISHDLKTPIASVKNYAEMILEDNAALDEQNRHFLSRIIRSADRMDTLIREVLAYSRISRQELGKKIIVMRPVLDEVVNELIAAYRPQDLQLSIGDTPDIKGDPVMLAQVFNNLIGNAIKYSKKSNPSIVSIKGKVDGGEILYSISDNGIGIDTHDAGQVFELFKRMKNAKEFEGTGVGLAIVKRIMEKHNGRIWYESEAGNGTIFYLVFQKD